LFEKSKRKIVFSVVAVR